MDLINSINIDLELDVPENEARSTSQTLCDGLVLPALERVMRRFEDEDIVVEQPLVLDMGDVVEGQLSYAVEDALYRALAKHRNEINVPLEAAHIMAAPKSVSEVFLEYLQFPVLPWDTENVRQFDEQDMMREVAQKALSSAAYLERIASLVMGDIETCKRFFDLPWSKEELLPFLQQLLQKIPALQGGIYGRLLRLFGEDKGVKPSLLREVYYYILSGVLFGNRRDAVNRETIAVLLVIGKEGGGTPTIKLGPFYGLEALTKRGPNLSTEQAAHHTRADKPLMASDEELDAGLASEVNHAITERRDVLKQRLVHDERKRNLLLRLIQLVDMVLKSEVPFSQHVAELERMIEELRREDATELGQSGNDVTNPPTTLQEKLEAEVSDEKAPVPKETDAVRLSEEAVVDIMATLSVFHDTERKAEVSETDKAGIQEVVAAIIKKQPDLDKRIPVHNAGLVLLQPFLISFFDRLGLLESRKSFKSLESQLRAAHLLHELSGFGGEHLEHLLPLNKLLCGINIMFPIGTTFEATEEERHEVEALLKAVIRNWSAIGKVSPAGFQEAFIRREGLLERSQDEWILRVESKGFDVLLDYIPWDIHTVSYPWNEYLIYVDWKA